MLRLLALHTSGGRTVSQKMVKNYIPDVRAAKNKKGSSCFIVFCILFSKDNDIKYLRKLAA